MADNTAKNTQEMRRSFQGTVVSDKGDKTVVVRVDRTKVHPLYHKRFTTSKRYSVHDEKNEYQIGDAVVFEETRPYSKTKRWRVVKKVEIK